MTRHKPARFGEENLLEQVIGALVPVDALLLARRLNEREMVEQYVVSLPRHAAQRLVARLRLDGQHDVVQVVVANVLLLVATQHLGLLQQQLAQTALRTRQQRRLVLLVDGALVVVRQLCEALAADEEDAHLGERLARADALVLLQALLELLAQPERNRARDVAPSQSQQTAHLAVYF